MSSLQDVARRAGVSTSLVSRYINGQTGVSDRSKKKIAAAMKELNYEPNAIARSLVTRRTMTIGVVMDTLCEPYFFPLIEGLEEASDHTDYDLVFSSGRKNVKTKQNAVRYFMQGRADGVLLYGSWMEDDKIIQSLARQSFPFVVVENTFPALNINNISLNSAFGSGAAVDHLIACGCRNICHVGGDMQHRVSLDRQEGFIAAMQRHGITVSSEMLIQADFDVQGSYRIMKEYLASRQSAALPDAFYCGSDNTAYGTIMALEEAGIHVPDDIMVVGFDDDQPPRGYPYAPLTTLSQPLREMGKKALEVLLNQIDCPDAPPKQVVYYPELIVRGTTRMRSACAES